MTMPVNWPSQQRSFTVNRHAYFCSAEGLHRKRWPGRAYRHAPVNSFEQDGQLCRCQNHRAAQGLRPYKAALLQSFGKQTQALSVLPQQLDDVTTPAPEHKDMATERVLLQSVLRNGCQGTKTAAHVGQPRRQPDSGACGQADHAHSRSAGKTLRTLAGSTLPRSSMRAPAISISMTPSLHADLSGSGDGTRSNDSC